jgi:transcription antitermination factor NusG
VAAAVHERLGRPVYFPLVNHLFRGRLESTPLFPGYVFIYTELQARATSAIHAIPGVLRLLSFGGLPQEVPASIIDGIRERVDRLNAQGGLPAHQFYQGEHVRLTAGPLQGLEAVFVGRMRSSERVKVLIEFLGQLREAELPVSALEKTWSRSKTKRPRRTRGRGRPIRTQPTPAKPG